MPDGSQMEEMTGAVGLGLFASDAVLALGRAIQSGSVDAADKPVLEQGLKLLKDLREPEDAAAPPEGPRQLGLGGTNLDVLAAIEAEAADADVDSFLEPLTEVLEDGLKGGDLSPYTDRLEVLRRVFMAIGDAEVTRVSNLSHPGPQGNPPWQTSPATFGF